MLWIFPIESKAFLQDELSDRDKRRAIFHDDHFGGSGTSKFVYLSLDVPVHHNSAVGSVQEHGLRHRLKLLLFLGADSTKIIDVSGCARIADVRHGARRNCRCQDLQVIIGLQRHASIIEDVAFKSSTGVTPAARVNDGVEVRFALEQHPFVVSSINAEALVFSVFGVAVNELMDPLLILRRGELVAPVQVSKRTKSVTGCQVTLQFVNSPTF